MRCGDTDPAPKTDKSFFVEVQKRVDAELERRGMSRTTDALCTDRIASECVSRTNADCRVLCCVLFAGAFELAVTFTLYVIATYYVSVVGSVWAAVVLGFLTGRLGFIMHSGNHQAISRNVWWNKAGGLMMDLIGSTHLIWSFEHQVAHHMDPNVYKKDNDCEIGTPSLPRAASIDRAASDRSL